MSYISQKEWKRQKKLEAYREDILGNKPVSERKHSTKLATLSKTEMRLRKKSEKLELSVDF